MVPCPGLRRLAAILLMGVLLFNWYGYQLLVAYWQHRADERLEARLDRDEYNESQLFSLKIPLTHISYYNSHSGFERVDGQIDIDGVRYKYVKRRLFKDSLELLCIRNETAMKLQRLSSDFFRQVNDIQQQTQGKKSPSSPVKNIPKDFTSTEMVVAVSSTGSLSRVTGVYLVPDLPSYYPPSDEMPPDQPAAFS